MAVLVTWGDEALRASVRPLVARQLGDATDRRCVLRSLLFDALSVVVVGLVVLIGVFYGFLYLTALL